MLSWQRIIYYLGLALVESTPAALLLTIAGADAWGVLIGVVLLGALADWIVLRRLPPERQTLALAAGGLLCALWVVKGQVVGDWGLLGDWGQALGAIFSASQRRSGIAYLSLLLSLYCFWRGTRLTMHDRVSIHRLFRTIAFSVLIVGGIGAFIIGRDVFKAARASHSTPAASGISGVRRRGFPRLLQRARWFAAGSARQLWMPACGSPQPV